MLSASAPAKINWTLDVLGRRPDGYHEVATVMSAISLSDEITVSSAPEWRVTVDAPDGVRDELAGDENLVHRAALAFAAAYRERVRPAHIHLTKRIPLAAGLGGGSSDAATTLRLLAELHGIDDRGKLHELAASLGSDVPFFLDGGTALATGRGETLRSLPEPAVAWSVLLVPPLHLDRKTARLYSLLAHSDYSDGAHSASLVGRLTEGGVTIVESDISNTFERAADDAFPGLARYRRLLTDAAGVPAHLCGAGPSLFALATNERVAHDAAGALTQAGHVAFAVSAGQDG